jgi:hypothetical protein
MAPSYQQSDRRISNCHLRKLCPGSGWFLPSSMMHLTAREADEGQDTYCVTEEYYNNIKKVKNLISRKHSKSKALKKASIIILPHEEDSFCARDGETWDSNVDMGWQP